MNKETTRLLTKVCNKCGIEYPATLEFFYKKERGLYGLYSVCKSCHNKQTTISAIDWRKRHPEKAKESSRKYYETHIDEIKTKREKNIDKIREQERLRYYANIESNRERSLQWSKNNPIKHAIREHNRRSKIRNLPSNFTEQDWKRCLDYHYCCCAVCGAQLRDLFGNIKIHMDHWIPLSSPECPGTVRTNMICLCSACNLSKNNSKPEVWLKQKFGKRKAVQIIERINQYFASLCS